MIVKNILSGNIKNCDSILISHFRPPGLKTFIKTLPYNHYLLGVGYLEGDYQICISGRKKKSETIFHTFNREMYEELSIVPSKRIETFYKEGNNYFVDVDINYTQLLIPGLFVETNSDDTKERAIICVHGTFSNIMDYLSKVTLSYDNNDSITHIWTDTVENILSYI